MHAVLLSALLLGQTTDDYTVTRAGDVVTVTFDYSDPMWYVEFYELPGPNFVASVDPNSSGSDLEATYDMGAYSDYEVTIYHASTPLETIQKTNITNTGSGQTGGDDPAGDYPVEFIGSLLGFFCGVWLFYQHKRTFLARSGEIDS